MIDTAAIHSTRLLPHWTPLGLSYIAATLERSGHKVSIIERDVIFRKNGLNLERVDNIMVERLRMFRPDMVGISSPTELFPDVLRVARVVKNIFSDIPVVYGGHHATAVPIEVLEVCEYIDIVVKGEGEETMQEMADGLDYKEVRGLLYRNGSSIIKNSPRNGTERLDDIPMPARHLLDMDFYTQQSHCLIRNLTLRATTMLTSRGCPFDCSFCVESLQFGKKPRYHSISRVLAELDDIINRYQIEAIYFLDEGFLTSASRVAELCEALIKDSYNERIKWAAQARVDSLNRDLLDLMKAAGCIQLECGFETASDRLLADVNKRTSHKKNLEIIDLIKSSGIRCLANIIMGLPGETEEEFYETVRFIKNSGVDSVSFSKFSPHPGSSIYIDLIKKGTILEKFWENDVNCYEKFDLTSMPEERFKTLYKEIRNSLIQRINTRDRMMNTSILKRMLNISFQELRYRALHSPMMILKFILNSITVRIFHKTR